MVEAKIIADSVHETRITTFEVRVPLHTWVHVLTHRAFSRNAQSGRGIPTEKLIERATYTPDTFPALCKGMSPRQAAAEQETARLVWEDARDSAVICARQLHKLGVHKEITNRLLSPFIWVTGLITATDWDNFFDLRCAENTQEDTRTLARKMKALMESSTPVVRPFHAPYADTDHTLFPFLSAARCARVSYLNHENTTDEDADIRLALHLLEEKHLSPWEHVAFTYPKRWANFDGWCSWRTHFAEDPESKTSWIMMGKQAVGEQA